MSLSSSRPVIEFTVRDRRATLLPSVESMPRKSKKPARHHRRKHAKGVRLVHGKIALRVTGYSGVQKLSPSHLVRYVPLTKLRAAAKRVLRESGVAKTRHHKKNKKVKRRHGLRHRR